MLDKGRELERKAHKFLWYLGYLPQSGSKFWFEEIEEETSATRFEEASDLDALGIRFDGFLHQQRVMVDCKHESEKVLTQMLRCKGTQVALGIDEILLLRSKVGQRHRRFGDQMGLRLMKVDDFEQLLTGRQDLGSFSVDAYERALDFSKGLPRDFKKEVSFPLGNGLFTRDPFERVKDLVRVFDSGLQLTPVTEQRSDKVTPRTWALLTVFQAIALTVVECASHLVQSPSTQIKADLQVRIAGDVEFKRSLIKRLKAIDRQQSLDGGGSLTIGDLAPTYTDALYEAIKASVDSSGQMQNNLRFLDVVMHGYLLLDKRAQVKQAAVDAGFGSEDVQAFRRWVDLVGNVVSGLEGAPDILVALR